MICASRSNILQRILPPFAILDLLSPTILYKYFSTNSLFQCFNALLSNQFFKNSNSAFLQKKNYFTFQTSNMTDNRPIFKIQ
jgi:hypothetical protein